MKLTIDQQIALFDRFGPDGIPDEEPEEGELIRRKATKLVKEHEKQFQLHYAS